MQSMLLNSLSGGEHSGGKLSWCPERTKLIVISFRKLIKNLNGGEILYKRLSWHSERIKSYCLTYKKTPIAGSQFAVLCSSPGLDLLSHNIKMQYRQR